MDEAQWTLIDIVGPAILLALLLWLVLRTRSNRQKDQRTEAGTRDLYREEEERRRDGTDDL